MRALKPSHGAARALKPSRRDPAPSRMAYRAYRLWLRPGFRRVLNFGLPMLAGLLASWTLAAELDLRARAVGAVAALRAAIVERPQFTITEIAVPGVTQALAEQIRVAAFVPLPASSLSVEVTAVRDRVAALDAVEHARVRALPSGVLEIRAIERDPVVIWRSGAGLELLDRQGVRVAEVDSRLRRTDLPLIAGEGAAGHVPEALALLADAAALTHRIRGLVRVGARRWDLVLDRDQVIKLPETAPRAALAHVLAMDRRDDLLARDLGIVDMRDPARPMLRMNAPAAAELARLRAIIAGEDA